MIIRGGGMTERGRGGMTERGGGDDREGGEVDRKGGKREWYNEVFLTM